MDGFDGSITWDTEALEALQDDHRLSLIPKAWRQSGQTRLDGLLDYVPNRKKEWNTHPWRTGHTMQIFSLGGAESRDRERIAIVGLNGFTNYVAGNREIMTDSQSLVCEGGRTIRVKKFEAPASSESPEEEEVADESENEDGENAAAPEAPTRPGGTLPDHSTRPGDKVLDAPTEETEPDPHAGVNMGRDSLHVKGDAEIRFNTRTFMVKGTFDRIWRGGVVRLASMEGVIAGGFYTRAVGGPSLALSGMMTSDVYGGAVRAAACRLLMARLHYRAAKAAAWACGAYIRRVPFTIEPVIQVPPQRKKTGIMGKLQRLQNAANKALKVARWVCPAGDILYGLFNILVLLPITTIYYKVTGKKEPEPPPGTASRVHIQHTGLNLRVSNTATMS